MKQFLKITPLAFLVILCCIPFCNAAFQTPVPAAPDFQLHSPHSTRTWGPPPSWFRTYGGTGIDYLLEVVLCSDGGYAMVGTTHSFGAGSADAYLVRVDADGNLLWNKTYGGTNYDCGQALVELSDGFVIAGYSESFSASADVWLIRTDAAGNHLWNRTFGSTTADYGTGLVASSDGGLTIGGYTHGYGAGNSDFWLIHTNSTGHHQWNNTFGYGSDERARGLTGCSGGGYVIIGETDNGILDTDAWLVRTDASGGHLWNQTYGGTDYDYAFSVIECSTGGFAICGETYSFGVDDTAVWLIRTNPDGNHQWNKTYDGPASDGAHGIIEHRKGGFALAGYTYIHDPVPSIGAKSAPPYEGIVIRTDASGTHLWNSTYGGTGVDRYYGLVETSDGALVATGDTNSIDPGDSMGWLVKTPYPLAWNPAPTDKTLVYGAPLAYDLDVWSWFGVASWTINDTTNFAIDSTGIVSNATSLASSVYGLRVSVTDINGSEIIGEFTITVETPVIAPSPLSLLLAAGVILTIIVILLVLFYYFVLRKRK